jgi:hypothetical protein
MRALIGWAVLGTVVLIVAVGVALWWRGVEEVPEKGVHHE